MQKFFERRIYNIWGGLETFKLTKSWRTKNVLASRFAIKCTHHERFSDLFPKNQNNLSLRRRKKNFKWNFLQLKNCTNPPFHQFRDYWIPWIRKTVANSGDLAATNLPSVNNCMLWFIVVSLLINVLSLSLSHLGRTKCN